eukprot:5597347-Lingulodinium_polyedra.AAC.1
MHPRRRRRHTSGMPEALGAAGGGHPPPAVMAVDMGGQATQRLIQALQNAGIDCSLTLLALTRHYEAWYGRPHTAAMAAGQRWGSRV